MVPARMSSEASDATPGNTVVFFGPKNQERQLLGEAKARGLRGALSDSWSSSALMLQDGGGGLARTEGEEILRQSLGTRREGMGGNCRVQWCDSQPPWLGHLS